MRTACRHILAIFKQIQNFNVTFNFIHDGYKVDPFRETLEISKIIIPPNIDTLASSSVRPQARYNGYGNEDIEWMKRPGGKQNRRFASNGVFKSGGKVFSSRSSYALSHPPTPESYDMTTDSQLLLSSISGPERRKQYQIRDVGKFVIMRRHATIWLFLSHPNGIREEGQQGTKANSSPVDGISFLFGLKFLLFLFSLLSHCRIKYAVENGALDKVLKKSSYEVHVVATKQCVAPAPKYSK